MKRAIREHWKDFAAILGLLLIAAAVSGYILTNQRFRFPLHPGDAHAHRTPSSTTRQAVTPGQGQTVEVAGVKIGLIANVKLRDGRARRSAWTSTREFNDVVHTDGVTGAAAPAHRPQGHVPAGRPGDPDSPVAKDGLHDPGSPTR